MSMMRLMIKLAQPSPLPASASIGDAGKITVKAANLTLQQGSITTQAELGDGGNIRFEVSDILSMDASRITTSVGAGEGTGGNIFIDPKFVVLAALF